MYIPICFIFIVLHYLLTVRLCNTSSITLQTLGKILGLSVGLLCLLTIVPVMHPAGIVPPRFSGLLGAPNIWYCLFFLQIYGIILLNDKNIFSKPPYYLYIILVPLYFGVQAYTILQTETYSTPTLLYAILCLIFTLDYVDDYLIRIAHVRSAFLHYLLWIPILLLMGLAILGIAHNLLSVGISGFKDTGTALFHVHYFWVGFLLIFAVSIIVYSCYQYMPALTRNGSNCFWGFFAIVNFGYLFYELCDIISPSDKLGYHILAGWVVFIAFVWVGTGTDIRDCRCPRCHLRSTGNYTNTSEGAIRETSSDEDIYDHREEQWDRTIDWYRRRRTVTVKQDMIHHYRCKDCGETWTTSSTKVLSRRSFDV